MSTSRGTKIALGLLWASLATAMLAIAVVAAKERPADAPVLTTEQKQAIQILAQRIELSQLRAQAAQAEFERAGTELGALLKTLQKDGFTLNLQTLAYEKKAQTTATK